MSARLTSSVLRGAYRLFAVPHLIFHVTHLENFTTAAAVGQTTALAIAVLPAALLFVIGRRSNHPA